MLSFYHYTRIAKLLRVAEALIVSAFLLYISTRLPFAFKVSGEYFRLLLHTVASPLFVFLLGNAIVFALVLKSGNSSSGEDTELYEELIDSRENGEKFEEEREEIVFQDKEIICEERDNCNGFETDSDSECPRVIRRTKSEKAVRRGEEAVEKPLRRSETEVGWKTVGGGETTVEETEESEMSNEEFQRTIEDFIAKQLKFRREESMAIVLRSQG